ncbi:hypothetical protein HZH68_015980 [Vespula germanica]|uniref:Uncharacterized protein n=1 Tax=Vespula germanica TaxID=30212 RepID=A0A834MQ90_VESGE|nr:hypothetical protein HZH68_015980 [Vespula germanica]
MGGKVGGVNDRCVCALVVVVVVVIVVVVCEMKRESFPRIIERGSSRSIVPFPVGVCRCAVDMVGSSTKSESTLLTSATREDAGVEVEVGICRSSSYTILPVESCLHRNITDEAVRNSIDRLAGSIIGNHIEELDELDNSRIDRADLLSKRFSKLADAFRAHLSGKTTGHHGSWLIETRRRCLKMCNR